MALPRLTFVWTTVVSLALTMMMVATVIHSPALAATAAASSSTSTRTRSSCCCCATATSTCSAAAVAFVPQQRRTQAAASARHYHSRMVLLKRWREETTPRLPATPAVLIPRGGGEAAAAAGAPRGLSSTTMAAAPTGGGVVFDSGPFWKAQSVIFAANALGWLISVFTGSHLHLDLLGAGSFGLAAAATTGWTLLVRPSSSNGATTTSTTTTSNSALAASLPRIQWSTIAVVTWSVKLATFLLFRILKVKKDVRLADTLSTVGGTSMFWILSWLWVAICSLPYTLGTASRLAGNSAMLKVGGFLYTTGLVVETLADYQKYVFKLDHAPTQFCNVGLWSVSQHPNFFGNLLVWFGIFVMNASALVNPKNTATTAFSRVRKYKRVGLALLSPLFMYALFYGQASGTISNTMELFENKYGKTDGFQDYVNNVPLIFPNPFKLFKGNK